MSRDPLAVLRDTLDRAHFAHREDWTAAEEAIAQVEALVEGMRKIEHAAVLGQQYHHIGPGYAQEIECIAHKALQPFTPGQDSEGGGNG